MENNKMSLEDYVESINLNEEEKEEMMEFIMDENNGKSIKGVTVGYYNEEHQAKGYFDELDYQLTAALYEVELDGENLFIVHEWNEGYGEDEWYVFKDKDMAMDYLDSLENNLLPSLNTIMEEFLNNLDENWSAEVKTEYNNGGHFHSFNVYKNNMLVLDGCFVLEEEQIKLCQDFETLENYFNEQHGLLIAKIIKTKGNPSWEKSYEITISDGQSEVDVNIDLNGWNSNQGRPRSLTDYLKAYIDIDEIKSELKEQNELEI